MCSVLLDNVFVKSSHLISLFGLYPFLENRTSFADVSSLAGNPLLCVVVNLFLINMHYRLVVILFFLVHAVFVFRRTN